LCAFSKECYIQLHFQRDGVFVASSLSKLSLFICLIEEKPGQMTINITFCFLLTSTDLKVSNADQLDLQRHARRVELVILKESSRLCSK